MEGKVATSSLAAMAAGLRRCRRLLPAVPRRLFIRRKTTSAQYVAARPRDPIFEKLMADYRLLPKIFTIQDLILSSPGRSFPLPRLARLSQTVASLRLAPTALGFVRKFPHVFALAYDPDKREPLVKLTPAALQIVDSESAGAGGAKDAAVDRLVRVLSMSLHKAAPLRAIFRVWRELGLPDDFEDSLIAQRCDLFRLENNPREPNTHILKLVSRSSFSYKSSIEKWRGNELIGEEYGFPQKYPPGMKLSKEFRARVKDWQKLPYIGPYEEIDGIDETKKKNKKMQSKNEMSRLEKRAVAIAHEFLSLTVEKMVEVEKMSHFRKWFGMELNVRDLFLDHPGIFYLSTKGKRHTVFLREAYDRGCLVEPNPIYEARRRLLHLVRMGRRGASGLVSSRRRDATVEEEEDGEGEEEEAEDEEDENMGETLE